MRKESIVYDKAFNFAIKIVKLYKYLCENKKEFIINYEDYEEKIVVFVYAY